MTVKQEIITTTAAAGAGGTLGAVAVSASGLTAAGMVGTGAISGGGIGAPAGPVGIVVGAVAGIAVVTVVRTANTVQQDPKVRRFVKRTRSKVGRWISGDNINDKEQ